jgi:hypothetical protein
VYVHNNPINGVDPQGLLVGEMLGWTADRLDGFSSGTQSPVAASVSSFAASIYRGAAGFDPVYATQQHLEFAGQMGLRDVRLIQQMGLKAGGTQALKEAANVQAQITPVLGNVIRGNKAREQGDTLSATGYYMGAAGEAAGLIAAIKASGGTPKLASEPPLISQFETPPESVVRVQHATPAAGDIIRDQLIKSSSDYVFGVEAKKPGSVLLTQAEFESYGAKPPAEKVVEFDVRRSEIRRSGVGDIMIESPVDLKGRNPKVIDIPKGTASE